MVQLTQWRNTIIEILGEQFVEQGCLVNIRYGFSCTILQGWNLTRCLIQIFNPLNPIVHFWLHHTAHCAEKIVSARLRAGSASAERVGQGEVGGVTGRVLCTWWLLGLALKRPWLVPGGPPHALTAWTGLENTTLTLQRAGFWPERLLGL